MAEHLIEEVIFMSLQMATFIIVTGAQLVTALASMNHHTSYQRCMSI